MKTGERGFTLIEILVSLAILGTLGLGIIWALGIGVKTVSGTDEADTARSIAESQLDYIGSLPYDSDGVYTPAPLPSGLSVYSVVINTAAVPGRDQNLQHVTVTVIFHGRAVSVLEGYKVK